MLYVYNVLAAILIGTAIGAVLGQRNSLARITCLIAVILGVVSLFVASWIPLAIGLVVFLIGQGMQRDASSARA